MAGFKSNETNESIMTGNIHHFTSALQQFDFTKEAIDVALRKLLEKVSLPKESQLIDQAMEGFAKRYYQCNSTLADSYDSIYAVAFSILLLHTDAHNKNVKRKMNKDTFIMRTKLIEGGESVYNEILDVMYDNIIYSEFSYTHDQQDKSSSWFSKKSGQPNTTLLHDLYPKLEQLMPMTNNLRYKYAQKSTNIQQSNEKAPSVLLAGVRTRQQQQQHQHQTNGNETFLAKVCKSGIVERKYDLVQGGKRSPARGWRPFGIILSGSQIMFFGDLVSFQSWLDSLQQIGNSNISNSTSSSSSAAQQNQHQSPHLSLPSLSKVNTPESNMASSTTFNSDQSLTTSTTSNLTALSHSTTSLTSAGSSTSNNISMTMTSSTVCLRPIQIVSLSNAICVYDESYRKYPHVFRLITGDGQQFLIRCQGADEMDDWIRKINYTSAIKTTGVRLRPQTTTIATNHRINHTVCQHHFNSQQQLLSPHDHYQQYPQHDDQATQYWMKREQKAKSTLVSLNKQLAEQRQRLINDEQLRNQLMLLEPMQKTTKDRMLHFAESIGKRLLDDRIGLERLECYREIIEWELVYYQSFKNRLGVLGDNGHSNLDNGKIGSISRKISAPLSFYSGLLHGGKSATSLQHTTNNHSVQPPSIEITTTNYKTNETDGNDNVTYSGVRIPRRSSSLLVSLSGDDGNKINHGNHITTITAATTVNDDTKGDSEKLEVETVSSLLVSLSGNNGNKIYHGDDLTSTTAATTVNDDTKGDSEKLEVGTISNGNRRRSCPHFNLRPLLGFNSYDNDHQQRLAPVGNDTTCRNYHDGCYYRHLQHHSTCYSLSGQQRNRSDSVLSTRHSSTGKDDRYEFCFPSWQDSNGNIKTHGRNIYDTNTDDDDDDDKDNENDNDDIDFVVTVSNKTLVDTI